MNDPKTIADAYIATWNEADADKRRSLLRERWTSGARYADPLMQGASADEIASLVSAVQERFPGFRFQLRGTPDGHGDYVRLSWSLGLPGQEAPIEGSDVLQLRNGCIDQVVGFIDRAPAAGQ